MVEELSHKLFGETVNEDLVAGADLLYEFVRGKHLNEEPIPNQIELMKHARLNFGIGLKDAIDCVKFMEANYKSDLQNLGYFSGR